MYFYIEAEIPLSPQVRAAALISAFKSVRDIPYYIAVANEPDFCCCTKADMLLQRFKELGVKARPVLTRFRWEDLGLPAEILRLPHVELEHHRHVEVYIPAVRRFVQVDPTWDAPLKHVLPVAEWDGRSDTRIAVPVISRYPVEEGEAEYKRIFAEEELRLYLEQMRDFLTAFNNFLAAARRSNCTQLDPP